MANTPTTIAIDAPEGFETPEVSHAKNEVSDLLGDRFGLYDDDSGVDTIEAGEAVVGKMIAIGWRPTVTAPES